jgi:hypothetical protein
MRKTSPALLVGRILKDGRLASLRNVSMMSGCDGWDRQ